MAAVADGGDGGKRSRKKGGRRYASYLRRLGCFRPAGGDAPAAASGGEAGEAGQRRIPRHLVVMVNGIIGSAANWKFAAKQFLKRYPEDVVVHCSECNSSIRTLDGVDVMGERLAKEVQSVVAHRPELQKISFIGHSLGGLIARYAIGKLYGKDSPKYSPDENREYNSHASGAQSGKEVVKGRIAGLEPMNFITYATPHLGSRLHKQIPILRGNHTLERVADRTAGILGRSGKHLFLKDVDDSKPPLLLQMANDYGDLKFISALRSFKRLVAYSNVSFDFIVGRKTSSIRRQHELPKRQSFTKNTKYPHIVYVEKPKIANLKHEDFSETMIHPPKTESEMEEAMIKGLNQVPWERVDVSFRKSKQRIFAHNMIQVKTYFLNSDGKDVVFHTIDNFLL